MFIGHFAIGLLAKKNERLPSLAMLFVAVQLLDLIWPVLVLLGVETLSVDPGNTKLTHLDFEFYPYSHSLLMTVFWGLLLGLIYYLFTKNRKGSYILGALVLSHWILDLITHRPDLPISPFTDLKVGLGLWNYPVIEIIFELLLFGAGAILYFKYAKPRRKISYWILIGFLLIIHLMNLFGPPPPDVMTVAWSANLMWLIVLWAWWIERKSKHS
jgi:membrane-bound metal-dependent hydrolase YbcI (DUF457 family)